MAGSGGHTRDSGRKDRRVERTRSALLRAFVDLVLSRGYEAIGVGDICERANVGRSTFYQHYSSKDDLYRQSLRHLMVVFADACMADETPPALAKVLSHMKDNRKLARETSVGTPWQVKTRLLIDLVEERLTTLNPGPVTPQGLPLRLAATQIACGQLAVMKEWLLGNQGCAPEAAARGIHGAARAGVLALLRKDV